jgi:hypothetical protein
MGVPRRHTCMLQAMATSQKARLGPGLRIRGRRVGTAFAAHSQRASLLVGDRQQGEGAGMETPPPPLMRGRGPAPSRCGRMPLGQPLGAGLENRSYTNRRRRGNARCAVACTCSRVSDFVCADFLKPGTCTIAWCACACTCEPSTREPTTGDRECRHAHHY